MSKSLILKVLLCATLISGCGSNLGNVSTLSTSTGGNEEAPVDEPVVAEKAGAAASVTVEMPALASASISAGIQPKAVSDTVINGVICAKLLDGTDMDCGTVASGTANSLVIPCAELDVTNLVLLEAEDENERNGTLLGDASGCVEGGTISFGTMNPRTTLLVHEVFMQANEDASPANLAPVAAAVKAGTLKPMEMFKTMKSMCELSTAAAGADNAANGCKAAELAFRAAMSRGKVEYSDLGTALKGDATLLNTWKEYEPDLADIDMATAAGHLHKAAPVINNTFSDETVRAKYEAIGTNGYAAAAAYYGKATGTDFDGIIGGGLDFNKNYMVQVANNYIGGNTGAFEGMKKAGAGIMRVMGVKFEVTDFENKFDVFATLVDNMNFDNVVGANLDSAFEGMGNILKVADTAAKIALIANSPTAYTARIVQDPAFYVGATGQSAWGQAFVEHAQNSDDFNMSDYSSFVPCATNAECSGSKICSPFYKCVEAVAGAGSKLGAYCTAATQCESQTCTGNFCVMPLGGDPYANVLKPYGDICSSNGECFSGSCYSGHCAPLGGILPPPASLTATAGNAQVALSWPAASGAGSYNIYRNGILIATSSTTSKTITGLTNGVEYIFKVAAVVYGVEGTYSDTASATPVVPISQQAYVKASHNAFFGDDFGFSVAISGDTMVVGAPYEDSNATGVNGNQDDTSASLAGAAYVFVRDGETWSQQAYLKASNTASDYLFGCSVAISGDTIIVGSLNESSVTANNGAAYVFVRDGETWSQQAYLTASNAGWRDYFGTSVAISGDTIVVGAYGEGSIATGVNGDEEDNSANDVGAAYVFVRDGTEWSQQAYLKASTKLPGYNYNFGTSVAISDNTIVVGARYEPSNATGVNGNEGNDSAGQSGAAYVFVRDGTEWSQQAYLKASNTEEVDLFGSSVSVSSNTIVVGAIKEDSSATGVNGDDDDNSAGNSGAAYVFVRDGSTWSQQAYLKASNPDGGDPGDQFGYSVGVSGDSIVVGAYYEDSSATGINNENEDDNSADESGAVYLFTRSGSTWSQDAYLKASNTESSDQFGYAVAISGDTIVAGANGEDSIATGVNGDEDDNNDGQSGAAYIFIK